MQRGLRLGQAIVGQIALQRIQHSLAGGVQHIGSQHGAGMQ
jgi:hypothetical protein